jgi:hypothetical protein
MMHAKTLQWKISSYSTINTGHTKRKNCTQKEGTTRWEKGKKAQSQAHPRAEYLLLKMKGDAINRQQFLPSAPISSDKPFAMINLYADACILSS